MDFLIESYQKYEIVLLKSPSDFSALQPGLVVELFLNLAPLRAGILIGYLVSGPDTDPGIYASFKMQKGPSSGKIQ